MNQVNVLHIQEKFENSIIKYFTVTEKVQRITYHFSLSDPNILLFCVLFFFFKKNIPFFLPGDNHDSEFLCVYIILYHNTYL